MFEQQPAPPPPAEEPSLLQSLLARAKRALGLDDPEPDSQMDQMQQGAELLKSVVTKSAGPERDADGLLMGDSRAVIHENVRTLRAKGLSEEDAIKKAHAAANRKKEQK